MSDIGPISQPRAAAAANLARFNRSVPTTRGAARESDRVELSTHAQLLARINDLPDVREDLVAEVRARIESGTYETEQKLNQAIDGLLEDM